MNIPRYNLFRISLPTEILPHFIVDLYTDILRDAGLLKLYSGDVKNCIAESLVGIDMPGIHVNLIEQKSRDTNGTSYVYRYWPKGVNAMRVLDDNEVALTFRHIDGFLNYYMMRDAVEYMSNDTAQSAQGEQFKSAGTVMLENQLTENYSIVTEFQNIVFSAIDGNSFKYSEGANENTFTVRCKFASYLSSYWYKNECISKRAYNHNLSN